MDYEKQRIIIRIQMVALHPDGSDNYSAPKECLFEYDLPRTVYERRPWVPRWRQAKLQCMYPKRTLQFVNGYYHPMNEEEVIIKAHVDKLKSAKRMVTKIEKAIEKSRKAYKPTLFCPTLEDTEPYQQIEQKLEKYRDQVAFYTKECNRLINDAA
jgi:hypothetical protein